MGLDNSPELSFAQGANVAYLESMYQEFLANPAALDQDWQMFFKGYQLANGGIILGSKGISSEAAQVEAFINAYRRLGHLSAHLNPLSVKPEIDPKMLAKAHGLDHVDPKTLFHPANLADVNSATFSEIQKLLQETYCNYIGADFRDINDIEIITWLQDRMESCRNQPQYDAKTKERFLYKLAQAEGFERFLQARFLGQKRFSLEGLEALIPMLDILADDAAKLGAQELLMGMAHRGRLNVLANFLQKNVELILKEFEQSEFIPHDIDGDVKYHLGFMSEAETYSNKKIRLCLLPNPSHLEAVNPVVEGFARSRQRILEDDSRTQVVPILIHGDAAFVGQGVVSETMNLAYLPHYSTGGTIHIVLNNQIGFTTEPKDYRSSEYSTGIAKVIRAPVLHVNADQPEMVVWAAQIAVAYRQKFNRDIVIDLVGYRRHGHNETDEPSFTQPKMYQNIQSHPTVLELYSKKLIASNVVSEDSFDKVQKEIREKLQLSLDRIRENNYQKPQPLVPSSFKNLSDYQKIDKNQMFIPANTAISESQLKQLASKITQAPKSMTIHPKLERLLEARSQMLAGHGVIDWPMAELLAFATLATEGHHVRLSGQDCGRGTFSSRQIVWRDIQTDQKFEPLNHLQDNQEDVHVIDSPLSEFGVVGFEFGYSVADKSALVLWEAQFGDFANGAQVVFDQFLVASEAKWKQTCGLVLLLPHGHEGAGPEHSSARPERFLQLCGNNNIQVAIPTTAAQYFHILRRQIHRQGIRKPLVIMTPKSLLREAQVCSSFDDFSKGRFIEILDDINVNKNKVTRLVFCTGKIYYELLKKRLENKIDHVALVRIEQLYPLHKALLKEIFDSYPQAKQVVWCQEEPQNMGAWRFVQPRMLSILAIEELEYVGRRGSGTTAEGSGKAHQAEQERILLTALGIRENLAHGTALARLVASTNKPKSKKKISKVQNKSKSASSVSKSKKAKSVGKVSQKKKPKSRR